MSSNAVFDRIFEYYISLHPDFDKRSVPSLKYRTIHTLESSEDKLRKDNDRIHLSVHPSLVRMYSLQYIWSYPVLKKKYVPAVQNFIKHILNENDQEDSFDQEGSFTFEEEQSILLFYKHHGHGLFTCSPFFCNLIYIHNQAIAENENLCKHKNYHKIELIFERLRKEHGEAVNNYLKRYGLGF